jgi:hypothetical protein
MLLIARSTPKPSSVLGIDFDDEAFHVCLGRDSHLLAVLVYLGSAAARKPIVGCSPITSPVYDP